MTWHGHIDSFSIQVVQSKKIIMINLRHALYHFFLLYTMLPFFSVGLFREGHSGAKPNQSISIMRARTIFSPLVKNHKISKNI